MAHHIAAPGSGTAIAGDKWERPFDTAGRFFLRARVSRCGECRLDADLADTVALSVNTF